MCPILGEKLSYEIRNNRGDAREGSLKRGIKNDSIMLTTRRQLLRPGRRQFQRETRMYCAKNNNINENIISIEKRGLNQKLSLSL